MDSRDSSWPMVILGGVAGVNLIVLDGVLVRKRVLEVEGFRQQVRLLSSCLCLLSDFTFPFTGLITLEGLLEVSDEDRSKCWVKTNSGI